MPPCSNSLDSFNFSHTLPWMNQLKYEKDNE